VLVRSTIYEEIRRDKNKGENGGEVKREIKTKFNIWNEIFE
jgi:hypothetical protein